MKGKNQIHTVRFIIYLLIVMAVSTSFIVGVFYSLYISSKNNIINMWQNTTAQTARDISYYLTMPMDAVAFSALKINEMIERDAPSDEVLDYLHDETDIYASTIEENTTGVYAYYRGEYLDGSRWVPPADYDPTARPWYTEAVENAGEITLVKPFLNLQTNTVMMSVSRLLEDGTSVVSMDVYLDGVQRIAAGGRLPERCQRRLDVRASYERTAHVWLYTLYFLPAGHCPAFGFGQHFVCVYQDDR